MKISTSRVIGIFATILFLVLLWYVRSVVTYLIIAALVSLIAGPVLKVLDKLEVKGKHLPNGVKSAFALGILMVVFGGILSVFVPLLVQEAQLLYEVDYEQVWLDLQEPLHQLEEEWLGLIMADQSVTLSDLVRENVLPSFELTKLTDVASNLLGGFGNIFIGIFSVNFITFFLMKERGMMSRVIADATPDAQVGKVTHVIQKIRTTISSYLLGLLAQVSLITILIATSLTIMGVKNALLIGFFAGLINVIPYVGPLIGTGFGIVIAITGSLQLDANLDLFPLLTKVVTVFGCVQLLDNFVFQPVIYSNSVKAHPLEIFLVILCAGTVFGITGMILAVPTYSILRIIAKEFFSEFKVIQSFTKNV